MQGEIVVPIISREHPKMRNPLIRSIKKEKKGRKSKNHSANRPYITAHPVSPDPEPLLRVLNDTLAAS